MDYQAWLKSQEEAADLSSISWLLNPPLNCNIHQSDTFEVVAVSLPTSIGSVRGPCTSGDMTNTGHTVLCDDSNFVALRPDGLGNDHVCRVSFVYWVLLGQSPWHECGSRCPKVRDVWLRMIEGDGSGDDVWLWVDGDEEWIRRNASEWFFPPKLEEEDWVAAQSALGRRLDRTRLTSSPASPKTANLTLENQRTNACLREATPAQRVAAMYWLIQTSTRKEELDFQLGLSSRWKFSLGGPKLGKGFGRKGR
ncbi:hypothetical protein PAXINDRAFT_21557 [Paxillus involutus ATCC 200175]|uniref:Uncharacterized protein n=1 Tax=Paxillus involutus ATCC 200175 TaxID=664439 RepID=A0A0C9T118_PAXIN|nr:hypothetical protein PAXINDRAFT_21557 [Paxillus involutus ATCC 200175]